jgi:hypothetical protein
LAAFIKILLSVSVESSSVPPFSVAASRIMDLMLRSASSSSFLRPRIACLMSLSICDLKLIAVVDLACSYSILKALYIRTNLDKPAEVVK